MAAVNHFLQQFAEQIQFAGRVRGIHVVEFQQPEIAANLPQPQQRGEHHHAAFGETLRADGFQNFLAAGLDDLLIDAALIGRQFAEGNLLDLRRQIRRNIAFQAAQHEGPQPPGEPGLCLRIFLLGDGQFVALAKILCGAEIAGHEKIENGPQIQHRVFQRRAGQHQPVFGAHGFHGLRILRLAVLDVLRLVQHDGVEFQSAIFFRIAADERVARDDHIARGHLRKARVPIRSVQGEDF